jgi:hypothetical protein
MDRQGVFVGISQSLKLTTEDIVVIISLNMKDWGTLSKNERFYYHNHGAR